MDSQMGKNLRLSRLLRPSTGRGLIVAASHPILVGPMIDGQRTMLEIRALYPKLAAADAIMTIPGTLKHVAEVFQGRNAPARHAHGLDELVSSAFGQKGPTRRREQLPRSAQWSNSSSLALTG